MTKLDLKKPRNVSNMEKSRILDLKSVLKIQLTLNFTNLTFTSMLQMFQHFKDFLKKEVRYQITVNSPILHLVLEGGRRIEIYVKSIFCSICKFSKASTHLNSLLFLFSLLDIEFLLAFFNMTTTVASIMTP